MRMICWLLGRGDIVKGNARVFLLTLLAAAVSAAADAICCCCAADASAILLIMLLVVRVSNASHTISHILLPNQQARANRQGQGRQAMQSTGKGKAGRLIVKATVKA